MQSAKVYLEVSPRNQYEIFNKGAYISRDHGYSCSYITFPTLSCILFKLKHSWNTLQTFILFI